MRPFEMAEAVCGEDIHAILAFCAKNGMVHSDRECFICGYYTNSGYLVETKSQLELDKADTIFVYMFAGNLKRAFEFVEPKKYIAFERFDGKIRLYKFDDFRRVLWAVWVD